MNPTVSTETLASRGMGLIAVIKMVDPRLVTTVLYTGAAPCENTSSRLCTTVAESMAPFPFILVVERFVQHVTTSVRRHLGDFFWLLHFPNGLRGDGDGKEWDERWLTTMKPFIIDNNGDRALSATFLSAPVAVRRPDSSRLSIIAGL